MVLSISFESKFNIKCGNLICKSEFLRAYTKDKRAEERGKFTGFFLSSMNYSCYDVLLHCTAQGLHCTARWTALRCRQSAVHCTRDWTARGSALHCTARRTALHCTRVCTSLSKQLISAVQCRHECSAVKLFLIHINIHNLLFVCTIHVTKYTREIVLWKWI